MALTTASNVAAMMDGIAAADVTASGVIGRVDALLARWCGYPPASVGAAPTLESASYTVYSGDPGVYVDAWEPRELVVEPYPVTSITSIHDDPDEEYTAAELVDSGDYVQRGRHGERIRLAFDSIQGAWSKSPRAIKVVMTAGWASVPADLEAAAIEMCAHLLRLRHARGEQSVSTGEGTSVTFRDETIPAHVAELLWTYRLPARIVP
jgi:hypothetical protein